METKFLALILIFVLINSCTKKKLTQKDKSGTEEVVSYYSNGKIKSSVEMMQDQRWGYATYFSPFGDTIQISKYENDSVVYKIEYDSLGNKTSDIRKIYSSLPSESFRSGDTIRVKFWIEGPHTENIYLMASALRQYPDTSIQFKKYIEQNIGKNLKQYTFVPDKWGIYNVKMYGAEAHLRKMIGEISIDIEVE